ncbi:MAG: Calx-beta domain-containing protein, partial [Phenylobacterium sp.]|nr:Calx-beta domain-containing protein [Phenylobacterium sp.]
MVATIVSADSNGPLVVTQDTATGTILDDDLPTVRLETVNGAAVEASDAGETASLAVPATYKVVLSNPSEFPTTVTLNWAAAAAGAGINPIEPGDVASFQYESAPGVWTDVPAGGQVTLAALQTELLVRVNPASDTVYEATENFVVNLTAASTNNQALSITDGQENGTISDEANNTGDLPTFTINDRTVNEDAGTITFTVTKTGQSELPSSVNYSVAQGSAQTPADYGAGLVDGLSGTLNFAANVTTQTITLKVENDSLFETSENFFVNLSGAVGATISDNQGIGTILDNDAPTVSIAVNPATIGESAEDGSVLTFTISLSNPSSFATTVTYTLSGQATEGSDYTTPVLKTVVIPANTLSVTFPVDPTPDGTYEGDETVVATIVSADSNGPLVVTQDTATGTILDDDLPTVRLETVNGA